MMTAERHRRRQLSSRRLIKSIDRLLAVMQKESTELEGDIGESIRGTPAWRERDELLRSAPRSAMSWRALDRRPARAWTPRSQADRRPGRHRAAQS
jgi:hypothetical protein